MDTVQTPVKRQPFAMIDASEFQALKGKPHAMMVFGMLKLIARGGDLCRASYRDLARLTGLSKSGVEGGVKLLVERGLLRKGSGIHYGKGNTENTYQLLKSPIIQSETPCPSAKDTPKDFPVLPERTPCPVGKDEPSREEGRDVLLKRTQSLEETKTHTTTTPKPDRPTKDRNKSSSSCGSYYSMKTKETVNQLLDLFRTRCPSASVGRSDVEESLETYSAADVRREISSRCNRTTNSWWAVRHWLQLECQPMDPELADVNAGKR